MTSLWRQGLLACALALAGCGTPEADTDDGEEQIPVDSALALVLADLHLADARAESTGEPPDSLRRVALDMHGMDSALFARRLAEHSTRPEDLSALYGAVSEALSPSSPNRP